MSSPDSRKPSPDQDQGPMYYEPTPEEREQQLHPHSQSHGLGWTAASDSATNRANDMRSPPRQRSPLYAVPLVLAVIVLLVLGLRWWINLPEDDPGAGAEPRVAAPRTLTAEENAIIDLFEESSKSVVFITTSKLQVNEFLFNLEERRQGAGTGFLWDEHGHIVTNYHVISNASNARVTMADGTSYEAETIGYAPDSDLAVLRVRISKDKMQQYPPIPLGLSEDLQVGQKVLAIGNPFGLDQTLTTGVISGLGRQIRAKNGRTISDVIQTDAAINPGNSGGPLIDSSGNLIGVNTAIYSPSGAYAGIGFAIPSDTVNRIVPRILRKKGRIGRAGLGINIANDRIARQLAERTGVKIQGVPILGVQPGGAADRAGLIPWRRGADGRWIPGDTIVAVDGEKLTGMEDLLGALEQFSVGDQVTVIVIRDGQRVEVEVTLQELPVVN